MGSAAVGDVGVLLNVLSVGTPAIELVLLRPKILPSKPLLGFSPDSASGLVGTVPLTSGSVRSVTCLAVRGSSFLSPSGIPGLLLPVIAATFRLAASMALSMSV